MTKDELALAIQGVGIIQAGLMQPAGVFGAPDGDFEYVLAARQHRWAVDDEGELRCANCGIPQSEVPPDQR